MFKNSIPSSNFSINCKGKLLNLSTPVVMGILNATPDSFYNKGKQSSLNELVENAHKMIEDGATILDIGGMSSKPNATLISEQEEIDRVLPVIELIKKELPESILSIDTFRSSIAEQCIKSGVDIINDISGFEIDEKIIEIASKYHIPYICMHMQGTPQTMQQNPQYENVLAEVYQFLYNKIQVLQQKGVNDIIVDVGFGFGKTIAHNYTLLNNLSYFKELQYPILTGISRKSMLYKPLHTTAENALNATTAMHMVALQQGTTILRAHDVKEANECVHLFKLLS